MNQWLTRNPDHPLDRSKAWACAAVNLLLWPGMGTIVAKRLTGLVQMGVSGAGVVMVLISFAWFCLQWLNSTQVPSFTGREIRFGLAGVALFVLAWIWSAFSSITIVRASVAKPPKL
ncbi:MAG: hypothetical protein WCO56_11050 [Verrucomicrobiota bacterium]